MACKKNVLKFLPLANRIAARYAAKEPSERDEIFSAAYYGLIKASGNKEPLGAYIARYIGTEIRDALERVHSTLHKDRVFLAEYLSHQGNMEERAAAMGLKSDEVFKRLASMTVVVPLLHHHNIAARQESQLDEILEVCVSYLPERIRQSFLLKFTDQYTTREIAHLTGLPKSTIAWHNKTALDILRMHKEELADLLY
jgi:RNA polymerase sigma factor (sigma-70 family)